MTSLKIAGYSCCFLFGILVFGSCNGHEDEKGFDKDPDGTETDSISDTVTVDLIDTLVAQINEGVVAQGMPEELSLPVESPYDTVEYWTVEGEPRRISFKLYPEDAFIWPTFFVIDRKPIMVRYREWLGGTPQTAMEFFTYYRGDTIFYARERAMELGENQLPAELRLKDFEDSQRPFDELSAYYRKYWKAINDSLYIHIINQIGE